MDQSFVHELYWLSPVYTIWEREGTVGKLVACNRSYYSPEYDSKSTNLTLYPPNHLSLYLKHDEIDRWPFSESLTPFFSLSFFFLICSIKKVIWSRGGWFAHKSFTAFTSKCQPPSLLCHKPFSRTGIKKLRKFLQTWLRIQWSALSKEHWAAHRAFSPYWNLHWHLLQTSGQFVQPWH